MLLISLFKALKNCMHNVDYVFDIVTMLESRDIEISQKKLKAEYEKIKRK